MLSTKSKLRHISKLFNYFRLHTTLMFILIYSIEPSQGSLIMKRLYEDLFTDYNRLILPITSNKTKVTVTLGLKLGQILDFNLKQQILSTNVWVEQTWQDHRLEWDPNLYEGIKMIHVPAENIWIPDIVLFNNADGNYELTLVAKAVLYSNGTVVWKPPTMFRSTCEVDVEFFPFDIQTCFLRFGSWTYAGDEVEIRHVGNKRKVDIGIDLSQFYKNVEWDIIDVPAYYNEVYYECCNEPFPDVTFKIVIRRKMLFYLVNLILPVALMTFMTVSVFYLPSDSNEKVTLSISILTSLIVFFLLMLEIIPPTSLAVPLFGKYLLFTLVLVSLSACVSVYVLNIHHRSPSVHQMSPKMRQLFLKTLPRILRLDRPDPRERSSLNRFRKKKIAQQMLQARQYNKVYDLAQPLATSLNLIETLHKSYDAKGDNVGKSTGDDDDDEGRYFRRYIDNYISRLQQQQQQQQACQQEHQNTKDSGQRQCNCPERRQQQISTCCEHNKCCSRANQPLLPQGGGYSTRSYHGDWTESSAAATAAAAMPMDGRSYSSSHHPFSHQQHPYKTTGHFEALNDDTFDMTFDYDDHEDNNNTNIANSNNVCKTVGGLLAPPPPPRPDGSIMSGPPHTIGAGGADLDDLPSPPPPPRQLTKLSDSMKELSGRLSSCSLQQTRGGLTQNTKVNSLYGRDFDNQDNEQLVDNLINSIHLINNASDDIDTTTTTDTNTSNGDVADVRNYRASPLLRANNKSLLANDASISPLAFDSSTDDTHQHLLASQNQTMANKCICNTPNNTLKQQSNIDNNSIQQNFHYHHQPTTLLETTQSKVSKANMKSEPGNLDGVNKPSDLLLSLRLPYDQMPAHVRAAIRSILFIADSIKNEDDENSAIEDWESMSMVVDRLFLWIFFILCTFGSLIILALAPSLYDQRDSIDDKLRIDIPPSNCSALLLSKDQHS